METNIETKTENEVPENEIDKVETPEQNKSKTFTQEELNKVVQNRVKTEQTKAKEQADLFETEKQTLQETINGYESIISKQVEDLQADIPENYRILFDKLNLIEKWEFLNNPANKIAKKEVPTTPKTTVNESSKTVATKQIKIF
jgi:hypothetical protein